VFTKDLLGMMRPVRQVSVMVEFLTPGALAPVTVAQPCRIPTGFLAHHAEAGDPIVLRGAMAATFRTT